MKVVKYQKKVQKNNLVKVQGPTTERNITEENTKALEPVQESLPFHKIKWKLALLIISGAIIIAGGIVAIVHFVKQEKTSTVTLSSNFPEDFNLTKAKEVFGSTFKIM